MRCIASVTHKKKGRIPSARPKQSPAVGADTIRPPKLRHGFPPEYPASDTNGRQTGSDIYYYPSSVNGKRFAEIIESNLKKIYPEPSRVRALATTKLYELNNTKAPAVLAEIAYHDNALDAEWIKNNLDPIAKQLALSVTEYFGVPLVDPAGSVRKGRAVTQGGRLNIREAPDINSVIVGQIPNGAEVVIKGREGDWYLVGYKHLGGYSYAQYIIPS